MAYRELKLKYISKIYLYREKFWKIRQEWFENGKIQLESTNPIGRIQKGKNKLWHLYIYLIEFLSFLIVYA